jgi:hypothetical protein
VGPSPAPRRFVKTRPSGRESGRPRCRSCWPQSPGTPPRGRATAAVTGRISKIAGRNADDAELRVHAGRREDLARFYEVRDDLGRRREGSSLVGRDVGERPVIPRRVELERHAPHARDRGAHMPVARFHDRAIERTLWRRPIRRSRRGRATWAHHRASASSHRTRPLVFRPRRPAARPPRRGGTAPLRLPRRGARWRGRVGREQRPPGGRRSRQRTRTAQRQAGAPPGRR